MEMTRPRVIGIASGLSAVAAFSLFIFLYQPLLKKIQAKGTDCRMLEARAEQVRRNVSILAMKGRETNFIGPDEIAPAIEELTQRGRARTITFLSITPRPMEKTDQVYQLFPIDMEIESSYQALGEFLGDLDELEKCLVTVRSFEMAPLERDEDKLRSKLTVNMHLRG